jgi:X-X-X-Leu-X-X-Gly heptad repeat protein
MRGSTVVLAGTKLEQGTPKLEQGTTKLEQGTTKLEQGTTKLEQGSFTCSSPNRSSTQPKEREIAMSLPTSNQPSKFQSHLTTAASGFTSTSPKAPKQASPETKAIAKVKSAQTREARGTMGKKQKLAISGTPEMTVQILGPDGQPVEASSPSTTTAASSTSSAAPSVAAPEPTT